MTESNCSPCRSGVSRWIMPSRSIILATALAVGAAWTIANRRADAAQKTTLTVWEYFSQPSAVKTLHALAHLFEKTHPDVHVKYVFVPYDHLPEKVIAAAGAKSGPDVIVYTEHRSPVWPRRALSPTSLPTGNSSRGATSFPVLWFTGISTRSTAFRAT